MSVILGRKNPRRAFRREVFLRCQAVRERDFRLVSDLALDLSTDGMLVTTNERVLTGEPLLVSFRLPRSQRWLDLSATVARVVHGRRPADRGRCLGLTFQGIDPRAQRLLFEQLKGLPPPDPARPAC
jgi:c-di-GMP-binding flagellar brake protein YcgR